MIDRSFYLQSFKTIGTWYWFCVRDRVDHRGCNAAGRIKSMKNINVPNGNRTCDLVHCSAVPQLTAPPMQNYQIGYTSLAKLIPINSKTWIFRCAVVTTSVFARYQSHSWHEHLHQSFVTRTWMPVFCLVDLSVHPITSPRVPLSALIPIGININTCSQRTWLYRPPSAVKERQMRDNKQEQSWLPVTRTMLLRLAQLSAQFKNRQQSIC
jgi:hypothetical protein